MFPLTFWLIIGGCPNFFHKLVRNANKTLLNGNTIACIALTRASLTIQISFSELYSKNFRVVFVIIHFQDPKYSPSFYTEFIFIVLDLVLQTTAKESSYQTTLTNVFVHAVSVFPSTRCHLVVKEVTNLNQLPAHNGL